MEIHEARGLLGLTDDVSLDDVRTAYRLLLRQHHPDVAADAGAAARTTALIAAYETVVTWAGTTPGAVARDGRLHWPEPPAPPPPPPPPEPTVTSTMVDDGFDVIDAQALDADTIAVSAPPPETYAALHEAASRVGEVAYVDRQLGIVETMVRFEGGPTCSVVMTLQGRAEHTEVFCTMESIEAAPTPSIAPVIDALVEALRSLA